MNNRSVKELLEAIKKVLFADTIRAKYENKKPSKEEAIKKWKLLKKSGKTLK